MRLHDFERLRFGVVRTVRPGAGRRGVAVPLPDLSRLSGQPAAVSVKPRRGAPAATDPECWVVVGDKWSDVALADAAGARGVR